MYPQEWEVKIWTDTYKNYPMKGTLGVRVGDWMGGRPGLYTVGTTYNDICIRTYPRTCTYAHTCMFMLLVARVRSRLASAN